jgi:hypothetical protein
MNMPQGFNWNYQSRLTTTSARRPSQALQCA